MGTGKGLKIKVPSVVVRLISAACSLVLLPVASHALTPTQVFDKVKDAVVVVKTLDAQGEVKALGSGVILSPGRVATNCHVVEEGVSYRVGRGKQLVPASLYAEDRDKDICLLDAKGIQGKPAQLGKAAGLRVGDQVYAVGAPQGLELSLSDGIVAQLRGGPPPMIQTTAAISPGSSGGGLFDGQGRLVGLTTFHIEGGQNLNFAMPAEWIGEVNLDRQMRAAQPKGKYTVVSDEDLKGWVPVEEPQGPAPGRKPATKGRGHTEWLKRANALQTAEDWQGLFQWCQKWTKNEPENASAWYNLWECLHRSQHQDSLQRASLQPFP